VRFARSGNPSGNPDSQKGPTRKDGLATAVVPTWEWVPALGTPVLRNPLVERDCLLQSLCGQAWAGLDRGSWHPSGPTPVSLDAGLSRPDHEIRGSLRFGPPGLSGLLFSDGDVVDGFSFEELERLFEQGAAMVEPNRRAGSHESVQHDRVRVLGLESHNRPPQPASPIIAESLVRPIARPAVPILTVLDDGSLDTGEEIRIRRNVFSIGRSNGDLVVPNDPTLSNRHAEIRLIAHHGLSAWLLRDQGSTNRTFARVNAARLYPDSVVILGSRRYRLRKGSAVAAAVLQRPRAAAAATCQIAIERPPLPPTDSLVEIVTGSAGSILHLRGLRETIGRDSLRNSLAVDDPALAATHAELVAEPDGSWRIIAKPSRNGVWVSTQSTRLTACCFFQCGEQRFRFVLP